MNKIHLLSVICIMTAAVFLFVYSGKEKKPQDTEDLQHESQTSSRDRPFQGLSDEELNSRIEWFDKYRADNLTRGYYGGEQRDAYMEFLLNRLKQDGEWIICAQSEAECEKLRRLSSLYLFTFIIRSNVFSMGRVCEPEIFIANRMNAFLNQLFSEDRPLLSSADSHVVLLVPEFLKWYNSRDGIHYQELPQVHIPPDSSIMDLLNSLGNMQKFQTPDDIYLYISVLKYKIGYRHDGLKSEPVIQLPEPQVFNSQILNFLESNKSTDFSDDPYSEKAEWFIASCVYMNAGGFLFDRHQEEGLHATSNVYTSYLPPDIHAQFIRIFQMRVNNFDHGSSQFGLFPIILYFWPIYNIEYYMEYQKLCVSAVKWLAENFENSFEGVSAEDIAMRILILENNIRSTRSRYRLGTMLSSELERRRSEFMDDTIP